MLPSSSLQLFLVAGLLLIGAAVADNISSTAGNNVILSTTGALFMSTGYTNTSGSDTSGCAAHTSCSSCVGDSCIWCPNENICSGADFTNIGKFCSEWNYEQCSVQGLYMVYVGAALAGLVLLALTICICFCCCKRKKKNARGHRVELQIQEERESLMGSSGTSKTPRTDQRRLELMQKYGIKSKDYP